MVYRWGAHTHTHTHTHRLKENRRKDNLEPREPYFTFHTILIDEINANK
jgi:hypothetical protein